MTNKIKELKIIKRVRELKLLITTMAIFMFTQISVFADGDLESSIFATGTKALLNDLTRYLIILAPIVGGAAIAYFAIRKAMCEDEMDHKKWDKAIKITILSVVIAVTAGALIKVITGYYTA